MNETIKRYLISSITTFLSGFGLVLLSQIDNLSLDSLSDGTALGLFFVAVRAGVKSVLEYFLNR